MLIEMILAHLVGDYVLQTNWMAQWKCHSLTGVFVHGLVVFFVTILFSLTNPEWILWASIIGISHTVIDVISFKIFPYLPQNNMTALKTFTFDQIMHIAVILFILVISGAMPSLGEIFSDRSQPSIPLLILGYTLISMPAWVLIEFFVSGLVIGSPPDFKAATDKKYLGILERTLMLTFVIYGSVFFTPIVVLPRFLIDMPLLLKRDEMQNNAYTAELLANITLTLMVGLLIKDLV